MLAIMFVQVFNIKQICKNLYKFLDCIKIIQIVCGGIPVQVRYKSGIICLRHQICHYGQF